VVNAGQHVSAAYGVKPAGRLEAKDRARAGIKGYITNLAACPGEASRIAGRRTDWRVLPLLV
jgi:hypothetical protein